MTRLGTLYWIWSEERMSYFIAMLVKVKKYSSIGSFYNHYFLDDRGKLIKLVANTKVLEEDKLWRMYCKRILL